jgi:hypothetical protein
MYKLVHSERIKRKRVLAPHLPLGKLQIIPPEDYNNMSFPPPAPIRSKNQKSKHLFYLMGQDNGGSSINYSILIFKYANN